MADATSYAEAEAGGFTLSGTNALAAKIAAALLPISDTEWHDVVNDIAGTLLGSPTIGQEGATGNAVAGARYVDFDGINDLIDMGQSYTQATPPLVSPISNMVNVNGEHSMVFVKDWDTGDAITHVVCAERDASSGASIFTHHHGGVNATMRSESSNRLYADGITSGLRIIGYSRYATASVLDGYIDGVEDGLGQTFSNPNNVDEINLTVGGFLEVGVETNLMIGKLYLIWMFNEALDDAEHASLASNIWQVFVAGETTASPGDISQQQLLDAPAVSQTHMLVPVEIAQLQQLDPPSLTQEHEISVSELEQLQTLESADVTQDHQLEPDEVTQEQLLDAPSIAQTHVLAAGNLVQLQAIEAATLVLPGEVTPEAISQLQTLGALLITQSHQLAVGDLVQLQAMDPATIAQMHELTAADITQLQVLGEVTVVAGELILTGSASVVRVGRLGEVVRVTNIGGRIVRL